jgi:hypothetical protein
MKEMGGGGEQFQEMFKNMAKTMGGKGAKIDMNALERMTKHHEMKERMRNKLNKKKAAETAPATNFVLESTERPNNYVFKLPEEGQQPRSMLPPPRMSDEELIAEFEKDPAAIGGGKPAGETGKKKSNKKKKGKK